MSIFNTQADTYQNSFTNPMNPANMNPGWGIDPNLLTPSYTAGYRPQYNGPAPYNQYGRVGFFSGVNHLANPFAPEARWGNTIDNNQGAIEGVASRPFDSAVWVGQRVVAPIAAYGLAFNALGGKGGMGWNFGRAVGRGFGTGFVNAFGSGAANSMIGRGIIGASGGMAAGLGAMAIPWAAGTAAMAGAQRAVFNPYINNRMTARDMRENFSGVTFGDSTGNAITGGGLGQFESSRIASDITQSGIRDKTFSTAEYTKIADYSARAGLMDNVNSGQISSRVKDVAEQIKLIMTIARDPSIKGAIEELSKLQMGGASIAGGGMSVASGAFRQIGQYASIAGRSVQNVMNTVGAQGQYLYQSNGMTPYLGQLAAANVMGSFGAAERTGMLSRAQLARMGGVEGATQASLTGQINAGQSLFNKMALYNSYMNGVGAGGTQGFGANQTVSGVVSRFGTDFSKDPLGAYGSTMLYGRQMLGKQLEERGSLVAEDQAVSILKSLAAPRNDKGQYSAAQMMPVLRMLGMSDDDAIAYINQRSAESDPRVANQKLRALNRFNEETKRGMISQNFLYGGVLGGAARGVMNFGRSMTGAIGGVMTDVSEVQGMFGDSVQRGADWMQFGVTLTGSGMNVSDYDKFFSGNSAAVGQTIKTIDTGSSFANRNGVLEKKGGGLDTFTRAMRNLGNSKVMTWKQSGKLATRINELAKAGDKDAIAFLNAPDAASKRRALGKLMASRGDEFGGLADQVMGSEENLSNFLKDVNEYGSKDYKISDTDANLSDFDRVVSRTVSGSEKALSAGDEISSLKTVGQAGEIINAGRKINRGNVDDFLDKPEYAELKKSLGNKTGSAAYDEIERIYRKSAKEGLSMLGSAAFASGLSATGDKAKDQKSLRSIIEANGGSLLSKGISSAEDIDIGDLRQLQAKDNDFQKERSRILDILKTNRVDYATAQTTMNALDNSKSVKDFDDAVKEFGKAVDKMNGDGKAPTSTGTNRTMFEQFTDLMNRRDNQRQNGAPR